MVCKHYSIFSRKKTHTIHKASIAFSQFDLNRWILIPMNWIMHLQEVDKVSEPEKIMSEARSRGNAVCLSALNGDGLDDFCNAIREKLKDSMVWIEALVPFDKGELLSSIHQIGMVERTDYTENGTLVKAYVPLRLARLLTPMRQLCVSQ